MLKKLILFLFIITPFKLLAQNNTLTGDVFENDNRSNSLEGATIKNLTTKTFSLSNKDGHFAIAAKVGDLVSIGMSGYQTDTIYLTNLFPKNIYLRVEVNNLKEVDINGTKVSPYLGNLGNPDNKPAAKQLEMDKSRGGLRLNLGFGKNRKNQIKIQELEENDRYQEEINTYFNQQTIKELLKFEGPQVKDFMDMYRPTVEQVKSQRPFNYAYYTAEAYRAWIKLPVEQRKLQPLIKKPGN
ncbi:MAG: hypothetical protein EOP00_12575 [Pedobacter sp.]|nr:MAG: hypothetical protein EOP00_12575 [Pedobacter sp.]